jgi:3-hydroxybutyryl-CoA dehydrogenase
MQVVFLGEDEQWEELSKSIVDNECIRVHSIIEFYAQEAEIYLYAKEDFTQLDFTKINKPLLIHCVTQTLEELNTPKNVLRINGWQTFLQRPVWEIVGTITPKIIETLSTFLQKKIISVPDEVGFATAKIVSMIINEAYFALEDEVSSKSEIDIAMKLGTNYPYGPFEWAKKIGEKNIYNLLQTLSVHQKKYTPSNLLKKEAE